MTMVLDISLDRVAGHFISHRAHKVPIFPELPSPQLPLHLWISPKYLLRTHALQCPYYFANRILRRDTRKYVHMILRYFHLNHFTVPRPQYLSKQSLSRLSHLIPKNPLPVLRRPYEMISRVINRMAQSFEAHAPYYTRNSPQKNPFLPVLPHGASRVRFS